MGLALRSPHTARPPIRMPRSLKAVWKGWGGNRGVRQGVVERGEGGLKTWGGCRERAQVQEQPAKGTSECCTLATCRPQCTFTAGLQSTPPLPASLHHTTSWAGGPQTQS